MSGGIVIWNFGSGILGGSLVCGKSLTADCFRLLMQPREVLKTEYRPEMGPAPLGASRRIFQPPLDGEGPG